MDFDDNGDPDAVKTIEAAITVPSASSTFSYTVTGDDDGVDIIDMDDNVIQPILDGINIDNPDITVLAEETLITQINWKSGGSSVILIVSLETGADTDTEFYFVLDGKALPEVSSPADWAAVDADVKKLQTPTGSFAPAKTLPGRIFPVFRPPKMMNSTAPPAATATRAARATTISSARTARTPITAVQAPMIR